MSAALPTAQFTAAGGDDDWDDDEADEVAAAKLAKAAALAAASAAAADAAYAAHMDEAAKEAQAQARLEEAKAAVAATLAAEEAAVAAAAAETAAEAAAPAPTPAPATAPAPPPAEQQQQQQQQRQQQRQPTLEQAARVVVEQLRASPERFRRAPELSLLRDFVRQAATWLEEEEQEEVAGLAAAVEGAGAGAGNAKGGAPAAALPPLALVARDDPPYPEMPPVLLLAANRGAGGGDDAHALPPSALNDGGAAARARERADEFLEQAREARHVGDLAGALRLCTQSIIRGAEGGNGRHGAAPRLCQRAETLLCFAPPRPVATIRDCDAALRINEHSAKALKLRGLSRRLLGEWEEAAADLSAALSIDFDETTQRLFALVEPMAVAACADGVAARQARAREDSVRGARERELAAARHLAERQRTAARAHAEAHRQVAERAKAEAARVTRDAARLLLHPEALVVTVYHVRGCAALGGAGAAAATPMHTPHVEVHLDGHRRRAALRGKEGQAAGSHSHTADEDVFVLPVGGEGDADLKKRAVRLVLYAHGQKDLKAKKPKELGHSKIPLSMLHKLKPVQGWFAVYCGKTDEKSGEVYMKMQLQLPEAPPVDRRRSYHDKTAGE